MIASIIRKRLSSNIPTLPKLIEIPAQSPNANVPWTKSQQPKSDAYNNPRFEQKAIGYLKQFEITRCTTMTLISKAEIQKVSKRIVSCDGGGGALGHPKVYINLDKEKPVACGEIESFQLTRLLWIKISNGTSSPLIR